MDHEAGRTKRRIIVLGATGPTGLELCAQGLARGWSVTVLLRNPAKLTLEAASLHVVKGDVFDPALLRDLARDTDAVLSVLGAPAGLGKRGETTVYSRAARALVAGLPAAGAPRVVFCTSAGVEPHDPGEVWFYRYIAKPLFLQRGYDDMKVAEEVLRGSSLRWVLVRPGRLTSRPEQLPLRVSERFRPSGGVDITRGALARFMLDQVESDAWLGRTPTLSE